jgi:desulfoferrodoxin-like iron-binding protein
MSIKKNENLKHLESIRNSLEDYYNGVVYRCEHCGADVEMLENEGGDLYCPMCGEVNDYPEGLSLYDYFDDVLDINYTLNSNKELISVRLLLAWGGPNIYLDTLRNELTLHWWGDYERLDVDRDICDAVTAVFNELFYC